MGSTPIFQLRIDMLPLSEDPLPPLIDQWSAEEAFLKGHGLFCGKTVVLIRHERQVLFVPTQAVESSRERIEGKI